MNLFRTVFIYVILWALCAMSIRYAPPMAAFFLAPIYFIFFAGITLLPYFFVAHIIYAVVRNKQSPIWLLVPVVVVSGFSVWALNLTQHSNTVLADSKRASEVLTVRRNEECIELTSFAYDLLHQTLTSYLLAPSQLRKVSRDAQRPSPGCLLVRKFDDVEFSEGKSFHMLSIEALGSDNEAEQVGQIHWGEVTYPYFPPVFDSSQYTTGSGPISGFKWFYQNRYYFVGPKSYDYDIKTYAQLNYFLTVELGRMLGRKAGPYRENNR